MADRNVAATYKIMTTPRDKYLGFAEDVARLTFPQLSPKGTILTERPFTSAGTQAVKSLASFMMKIMMPPGVRWGEYDLPLTTWKLLQQNVDPAIVQNMAARLEQRSTDSLMSLKKKRSRSRFSAGILRNLVEGSTGVFNTHNQIRIYPLRSHVVEREAGEVRLAIFVDEITPSPMEITDTAARETAKKRIYTMVDYERGEVWRQEDAKSPRRIEEERPDQWFVFSSEVPDVDDYAVGYSYNFIRLIAQINHAESSLAEAMADAAFNPIGVKTGSPLSFNLDQIRNRRSGDPLVHQEGDLFRVPIGVKLGDWNFVVGMRNDDKQELAEVFAQGIKDRAISQDTSATAVLEIIDEINTQASDVLTGYGETFQGPLLHSEMALLEQVEPVFPDIPGNAADLVESIVTTGISAIERQRSVQRFVGVLGALTKLDETFRVHSEPIADELSKGMLLESEGFYSTIDEGNAALQQALQGGGGGGSPTPNGDAPREETIMTRGGPQPPQGAPPRPQ